jgi:hypothetical protein
MDKKLCNTLPPQEMFDLLTEIELSDPVVLNKTLFTDIKEWWNHESTFIKIKNPPPVSIYDLIHRAEEEGIVIPDEVDDWWTKETEINLSLNIYGSGKSKINTSIPFLDHMLELFAKHGMFDLTI